MSQDLPKNSISLLEGIFLFSLIWSIGATVDKDGRSAFNRFLRKLLHKGVSVKPDRSDFDLGPGLTIQEPEAAVTVALPLVSRLPSCGLLRSGVQPGLLHAAYRRLAVL